MAIGFLLDFWLIWLVSAYAVYLKRNAVGPMGNAMAFKDQSDPVTTDPDSPTPIESPRAQYDILSPPPYIKSPASQSQP